MEELIEFQEIDQKSSEQQHYEHSTSAQEGTMYVSSKLLVSFDHCLRDDTGHWPAGCLRLHWLLGDGIVQYDARRGACPEPQRHPQAYLAIQRHSEFDTFIANPCFFRLLVSCHLFAHFILCYGSLSTNAKSSQAS